MLRAGTTPGPMGPMGPQGDQGQAGPSAMSAWTGISPAFATAYQALDPTKPAVISVIVDLVTVINIGAPQTNTVEMIIGPTNQVAAGTGVLADSYSCALSVTLIQLNFSARQKIWAAIPAGYYWAVRRTAGTGITIAAAYDQAVG